MMQNNRFQARTLETDVDTVLGWLLESQKKQTDPY